eukprot:10326363-Prorocentrum_lima.AAC.1
MTSSLVGSEMCIRDRPCWSNATTPPSAQNTFFLLPADAPPMLTHFLPVSYTHLTLPTICSV